MTKKSDVLVNQNKYRMSCDVLVVMGVSGCGKTTVGKQLAEKIGWEFKDADDFHSEKNVENMRKGIPLTDVDRVPWLVAINEFCKSHKKVVVACSALKRSYRIILKNNVWMRFIFLSVDRVQLEERVKKRIGHFMDVSLLKNQLSTLEDPSQEDNVITVRVIQESPKELIDNLLAII